MSSKPSKTKRLEMAQARHRALVVKTQDEWTELRRRILADNRLSQRDKLDLLRRLEVGEQSKLERLKEGVGRLFRGLAPKRAAQ
jgi:hypothetical protein